MEEKRFTISKPAVCARPRRRAAKVVALAVTASVALGGLGAQPVEAASARQKMEKRFTRLINKERARRDIHRVKYSYQLARVARKHSKKMADSGILHHRGNLASGIRGDWRVLGENVGVGGSVKSLHRAFMRSPGHKANVLYRKYRRVGVGVVRRDGVVWVTVIFKG